MCTYTPTFCISSPFRLHRALGRVPCAKKAVHLIQEHTPSPASRINLGASGWLVEISKNALWEPSCFPWEVKREISSLTFCWLPDSTGFCLWIGLACSLRLWTIARVSQTPLDSDWSEGSRGGVPLSIFFFPFTQHKNQQQPLTLEAKLQVANRYVCEAADRACAHTAGSQPSAATRQIILQRPASE